jgi:hypothetical protein
MDGGEAMDPMDSMGNFIEVVGAAVDTVVSERVTVHLTQVDEDTVEQALQQAMLAGDGDMTMESAMVMPLQEMILRELASAQVGLEAGSRLSLHSPLPSVQRTHTSPVSHSAPTPCSAPRALSSGSRPRHSLESAPRRLLSLSLLAVASV